MLKRSIIFTVYPFTVMGALGQVSPLDRSRLSTAAFYSYSEPGDVTIRVHVWGAVRFPGLYEIPRDTRLSELISLSGGPQFAERSKHSARTVIFKLHRSQGMIRSVVFNTVMENEIVVTDEDPVLQSDDVLSIEAIVKQGFRWRDVFPVVSMVATLTIAIDRFSGN